MTLVDITPGPGPATTAVPFTLYDIQACLYDAQRVEYLREAILATVKPGHVVVEAGSGTGLLSMFAAEAGAAEIYCLELNPAGIPIIRENARRNGYANQMIAVHADATTWEPPPGVGPFDVIISEVMSAGFYYEPQIQILNHLRKYLKPDGAMVPTSMRNHIELLDAQEMLYGKTFTFDTRFTSLPGDTAVSTAELYFEADFYQHNPTHIAATRRLRALTTGVANAVRISYDITFAPGITATEPTEFLLNPQIVFLPAPVKLEAGAEYDVAIAYEACGSPLDSVITVNRHLD